MIMREAGAIAMPGGGLRLQPRLLTTWETLRRFDCVLGPHKTKPRPPREPGVYGFANGAFVKVGRSSNVSERFRQLQKGTPVDLVFLGLLSPKQDHEELFHERLVPWRVRDEWFRLERASLQVIAETMTELAA